MTAGKGADADQAEMLTGSLRSRIDAQAVTVQKSSDTLIAYMKAERALVEATCEAERLRVALFKSDDQHDAFVPAWARGRFPFNRPAPTLRDRMPTIQRMLSSLYRSRDIWFDDFGNVGSENDTPPESEPTP